uniref:Uncharacterized protein n=1 Tax=Arundo donax TaxID=35708 RepID=A0A0A9CKU3_ARUDO
MEQSYKTLCAQMSNHFSSLQILTEKKRVSSLNVTL